MELANDNIDRISIPEQTAYIRNVASQNIDAIAFLANSHDTDSLDMNLADNVVQDTGELCANDDYTQENRRHIGLPEVYCKRQKWTTF